MRMFNNKYIREEQVFVGGGVIYYMRKLLP